MKFAHLHAWLLLLTLSFKAVAGEAASMPVSFGDVLALPVATVPESMPYGASPSQRAWLWAPAVGGTEPVPVIVLIHGGCWLSQYDANHVFPLAARLAGEGYAVFVPEYRRVGEDGGGWPGTLADVDRALQLLARRAPSSVDLGRTVLVGHSAGGHLALWLAGRDPSLLPAALEFAGAIGLAPITDLESYAAGGNSCQQVTAQFMGGEFDAFPARYAQASPSQRPLFAPALLLRGSGDPIVGAEQIEAMRQHANVRASSLPGAGHFDWIHPETRAFGLVLEAIGQVVSKQVLSAEGPLQ